MSSENSTFSKIRQFGLYRTVDSRTQEFLKLSKKRQIRQGCICAAVSTAVTVIFVITILLIFEYFIAVYPKSIQTNTTKYDNKKAFNTSGDKPFADKLDSTDFGFDQESYERMPLLVNAMEENSNAGPALNNNVSPNRKSRKLTSQYNNYGHQMLNIRRTSPYPFNIEYESPTPTPFFHSQKWLETYRYAQRLKNLEKVIHYLENTMIAKFGPIPSNALNLNRGFADAGFIPIPSESKNEVVKVTTFSPKLSQETIKMIKTLTDNSYRSDILFGFKPENPGDINALAESNFNFLPTYLPTESAESSNKLAFKPIPNLRRGCLGSVCTGYRNSIEKNIFKILNEASGESKATTTTSPLPKSFSIMLDLIPEHKKIEHYANNIFITTERPKLQFKRKPSYRQTPSLRNYSVRNNLPGLLHATTREKEIKLDPYTLYSNKNKNNSITSDSVFHVNLYPKAKFAISNSVSKTNKSKGNESKEIETTTRTRIVYQRNKSVTNVKPVSVFKPKKNLRLSSSGDIKILSTPFDFETSTQNKMLIPHEIDTAYPTHSTNPPEILKFSHEDAKIPESYEENISDEIVTTPSFIGTNLYGSISSEVPISTIITKLKQFESNEDVAKATTIRNYTPQINGHYRSINQNSKNINNWFNEQSGSERKRNLEIIEPPCLRKSQYVQIRRENIAKSDKSGDV